MPRHVFYSFHYIPDNWRVSQIRNIGAIEGNKAALDNDWESIKRQGDRAIENWIASQMQGKSCVVVLAGSGTAGRKWIDHEIKEGWRLRKGVFGIHIHKLRDRAGQAAFKGGNPFAGLNLNGTPLSQIIPCYDPLGISGQDAYRYIAANITNWIEHAIQVRARY